MTNKQNGENESNSVSDVCDIEVMMITSIIIFWRRNDNIDKYNNDNNDNDTNGDDDNGGNMIVKIIFLSLFLTFFMVVWYNHLLEIFLIQP